MTDIFDISAPNGGGSPQNILSNRRLLNEKEVAERLNVEPATLRGWRVDGKGPTHIKLAGWAIRYEPDVIEAFIEASRRTSTSDQGEEAI